MSRADVSRRVHAPSSQSFHCQRSGELSKTSSSAFTSSPSAGSDKRQEEHKAGEGWATRLATFERDDDKNREREAEIRRWRWKNRLLVWKLTNSSAVKWISSSGWGAPSFLPVLLILLISGWRRQRVQVGVLFKCTVHIWLFHWVCESLHISGLCAQVDAGVHMLCVGACIWIYVSTPVLCVRVWIRHRSAFRAITLSHYNQSSPQLHRFTLVWDNGSISSLNFIYFFCQIWRKEFYHADPTKALFQLQQRLSE